MTITIPLWLILAAKILALLLFVALCACGALLIWLVKKGFFDWDLKW